MAEDRTLPGFPKKKLVREVRSFLRAFGIQRNKDKAWAQTWQWAHQIAYSYVYPRYPLPSEIASQYVFLLLSEMKALGLLRLPYRAAQFLPEQLLGTQPTVTALLEEKAFLQQIGA